MRRVVLLLALLLGNACGKLVFDRVSMLGSSGTHKREDPANTVSWFQAALVRANGTTMETVDGGATWHRGSVSEHPLNAAADIGNNSSLLVSLGMETWYPEPTSEFVSKGSAVFSFDQQTKTFSYTASDKNVTWTGLPFKVLEFSVDSGGIARLPNGSLVATPVVWVHDDDTPYVVPPTHCCNDTVVSFISDDGGYVWRYAGLVAAKWQYQYQEGPNENNIVLLADQQTLWVVFRVDGGDGVPDHPHVPYMSTTSTDGGYTWSVPRLLPSNVQSCKPKAAVIPASGALVVSGGRPALNVWESPDGFGDTWEIYDIPTIHNQLMAEPDLRFCTQFENATTSLGWAQSSGYTTINVLSPTEGLVCYERQGFPSGGYEKPIPAECIVDYSTVFCMTFHVEA